MCILCDFSHRAPSDTHRPGPYNVYWPDAEVTGGTTIAATLGESRLDAPDGLGTTYSMTPGDTFEGFIGRNDVDVIRLDIDTTGNFEPFEVAVQGFGEGELYDPFLELLDDTGEVIASNDNVSVDTNTAALLFESFSSGTYYLRVGASDGGMGGYQVTALEDAGASWIASRDLGRFERTTGFLSAGDVDYYEVDDYFSGTPWSVSVYGVGDAGLADVSIKVFEGFTEIASNALTGRPVVTFEIGRENADYRFEISGGDPASTGLYELRSSPNPVADVSSFWFVEPGFFYNLTLEPGDADWQYADLIAGREYSFEMYGLANDDLDPVIALYDAFGTFVAENDNESADSTDAFLRYTPSTNETVFIETRDSSQTQTGVYGLAITDLTTASPISAITWNDAALPTDDAVAVWFAPSRSFVNDQGVIVRSDGFTVAQRDEFMSILEQVSEFANIEFRQVGTKAAADIQVAVADLDGLYETPFLGRANPYGSTFYSDGVIVLDDDHWNDVALARGGFMNHVVTHEFGHALGLAHPHDYGGGSLPMLGVRDESDLGDFNLNQVPFTAMTYNDFWTDAPLPEPLDLGRGFLWGFGSLDIAALQAIYGANTTTRGGDDRYVLGQNDWLETIWDTGGHDDILYAGRQSVTIDLSAATARYDAGGGGVVTYEANASSGFVIAPGVDIEGGIGGFGWDEITGNNLDNRLEGRNGFDTLKGLSGDDLLLGGRGADTLYGNRGADELRGGGGSDVIYGGDGHDVLYGENGPDDLRGGDGNDIMFGGAGNDSLYGGLGNDRMDGGNHDDLAYGGDGLDTIAGGAGNDTLFGERDNDTLTGGTGDDRLYGNNGNDDVSGESGNDLLRGGFGNDFVSGGDGNDTLFGDSGLDELIGGIGDDVLSGGSGGGVGDGASDVFVFGQTAQGHGGFDLIRDFENGIDVIDLSDFGFNAFLLDVSPLAEARNEGQDMALVLGDGYEVLINGFTLDDFDAFDVLL